MAEFPALPLFTDAYLADTHPDLSLEEHGCYLLLMQAAWRRPNCDLPDDDRWFCKWLGIHGNKWRTLRASVLERFWVLDLNSATWHQKRLRKERDFVEKRARFCSEMGKKSVEVRRKNKELAAASVQTPTPTPTEVKKDSLSESPKKASDSTASHQCEATPEDGNDGRHGSGSEGYRSSKEPARSNTGQSKASVPRGTRCPWISSSSIPGECQEFARQLGLDPQAVGERFTDYWRAAPGSRGVKLDWPATWRNWCRREPAPAGVREKAVGQAYRDALAADARRDCRAAHRVELDGQDAAGDAGGAPHQVQLIPRSLGGSSWGGGSKGAEGMAGQQRVLAVMGRA